MPLVLRPDARFVWEDDAVRERLRWYRAVMLDEVPAKFRTCGSVAVDPEDLDRGEGELWSAHERGVAEARTRFGRPDARAASPSLMDLKVAIARRLLGHCNLCAWDCGVDRAAGKWGVCRVAEVSRVSGAFPHIGEEAPLLGPEGVGSGTIFFTGCTAHCVFCQNWDTARHPESGTVVDGESLALLMRSLRRRGCANINLVGGEPTPHLPVILEALARLDANVPIVWNSNMYLSREGMDLLVDVVDLWLPDLKYGNDECARLLSRLRDYTAVVEANLQRAARHGDMILRHLVLPGHVECCTKPALRWLAEHTPRCTVNIMDQYRPDYLVRKDPRKYEGIARRPSPEELRSAYACAEDLGLCWAPLSLG